MHRQSVSSRPCLTWGKARSRQKPSRDAILEIEMGKKPLPIENKLILIISKHGGSATLTEIRHGFGGRLTCPLLEHARVTLGDLIVAEKSRSKGSKRPTTRLSLTLRGWAAVQFLRYGWQPQRLAVDVLKAWVAELQAERDPWAIQFIRDAEDAAAWRHEEARRKEAASAAEAKRVAREKPAPKYPSAGRNRSEEDLAARREWAATKWPQKDESVEESEIRRESGIPEPSYYRPTLQAEVRPTAQDTPSDSGLAEKIRQAGYTVKGDRVQYGGNQWIPIAEWMAKESWRLG
jgi:hypothetical protein